MDVIPVALRIVEFDKERWPLDPIIRLLAAVQSARPSERDLVEAGGTDLSERFVRQFRACPVEVDFDEPKQFFALRSRQLRCGDALGGKRVHAFFVRGHNFLQRFGRENRCLALRVIQRIDQSQPEILFLAEHAFAVAWSLPNLGGIRAHERRHEEDMLAVNDREIE